MGNTGGKNNYNTMSTFSMWVCLYVYVLYTKDWVQTHKNIDCYFFAVDLAI